MTNPLILNIPHSSTFLPCDAIYIPDSINQASGYVMAMAGGRAYAKAKIRKKHKYELPFMTDWYTEELFSSGVGRPLVFPLSRLVCDIERFRDPSEEPMEKIGILER